MILPFPLSRSQFTKMNKIAVPLLGAGLAGLSYINLSLNSRLELQEAKLADLTLNVLRIQKKDIQTLHGASSRKDWLKEHTEHKEWSASLLKTQEANALAKPPRPISAKKQTLYNAAEQDKIKANEVKYKTLSKINSVFMIIVLLIKITILINF